MVVLVLFLRTSLSYSAVYTCIFIQKHIMFKPLQYLIPSFIRRG